MSPLLIALMGAVGEADMRDELVAVEVAGVGLAPAKPYALEQALIIAIKITPATTPAKAVVLIATDLKITCRVVSVDRCTTRCPIWVRFAPSNLFSNPPCVGRRHGSAAIRRRVKGRRVLAPPGRAPERRLVWHPYGTQLR
jgi:hypothetical protein